LLVTIKIVVFWVDRKLSVCTPQRHMGSGGAASLIHNLCTRWRWVVSLIPWYLMKGCCKGTSAS